MTPEEPEITYARIGNAEPVYAVKIGDHRILARNIRMVAMLLPEHSLTKVRKACRAARDGLVVSLRRDSLRQSEGNP